MQTKLESHADETAIPSQTVLIVESEVLVRSALAEYLRHCGHRVFEAANAAEARMIVNFHDTAINIVFSEVDLLGGETGFAPASWVHQNHPGIQVLLTAGVPQAAEKAEEVCEHGPLVTKPYGHQVVLRQIQQLLRRAGKHGSAAPE
jgi:DNA-binding NtrC family response regulator